MNAPKSREIPGVGVVTLRPIDADNPRPESPSEWGDWGPVDPGSRGLVLVRWLIELTNDGDTSAVGDMSAHVVWYGPTSGSRAMNIGISIVESHRGRGIGAVAQRVLAEELHRQGFVRVEASTDVENIGEQKALERAGFVLEGTLRKAQQRADGVHDLQVWSHLQSIGDGQS